MSEPEQYPSVTARVGGRMRRLATAKQLRAAIGKGDIDRRTSVRIHEDSGAEVEMLAGDCAQLAGLFDEILGPAERVLAEEERLAPAAVAVESEGNPDNATIALPIANPPDKIAARAGAPPTSKPAQKASPPASSTDGGSGGKSDSAHFVRTLRDMGIFAGAFLLFAVAIAFIWNFIDRKPDPVVPEKAETTRLPMALPTPDPSPTAEEIAEPTPEPSPSPSASEQPEAEPKPKASASAARSRRNRSRAEPPPPPPPPPRSLAREATPRNQRNWAARITGDYPSRAMREKIEGRVIVRVSVDTRGRVDDCGIVASSGSQILDEAACKNMSRHARFEPALDNAGNPIAGSYSTGIVYRLE